MNELYNNCTTNDWYKNLLGQDAADTIAIKAEEDRNWLDGNRHASEEQIDYRLKDWNGFMARWQYNFDGINKEKPWRQDIIQEQERQEQEWTRKRSRGEL